MFEYKNKWDYFYLIQNKWDFQGCLRKIHEEFPRVVTPNFKGYLYGFILDSLHAVLSEDLQHRISCITLISIQAEYYSFSQLICSSFVLHMKNKSRKRTGPASQICFSYFNHHDFSATVPRCSEDDIYANVFFSYTTSFILSFHPSSEWL